MGGSNMGGSNMGGSSMSTDPGRWALLCVHHQDGLHTAHVLLVSAAALVIALGVDDGVLSWPQLRLSGSRTNGTAEPTRCALGLAVHQE